MLGPSNRAILSRGASASLDAMHPETERQARGLIVVLTADPIIRLIGRLDIGMQTPGGMPIWGYQAPDFWVYFIEEDDRSLAILNIWQR